MERAQLLAGDTVVLVGTCVARITHVDYESLSTRELVRLVLSLVASYVVALPIGWERKKHSHGDVGLRVFPLLAVASCAYVVLGRHLFTGESSNEQADVLQGLMTGIGFVGAGAILKEQTEVHGLSTAAAVWTTGAIGAAIAYGYFAIAISLCLLDLFILALTERLRRRARRRGS